MMVISGPIKKVNLKRRIISLQVQDKVMYFYLQRNLMKKFSRYLVKGRFVSFKANEEHKVIGRYKTYQIEHFIKIIMQRHRKQVVYYDLSLVQEGIKELLEKKTHRMYLDLELSMHPFYRTKNFTQEIIQSGIVIEDSEGNIIDKSFDFVRPVKFPQVTTRTVKFLNITQDEVDNGISALEYHNKLKAYIDKYDPVIVVWGKNDMIALSEFAEISNFELITPREKFLNLLQIYKNYFNLKNDVGLFNCYESYGYQLEKQKHNALEDAEITRLIYHEFVKECNKIMSSHI
ncbi:exonuclease domain-containing protein [Mycoplasmatota bacterium WC44]